MSGTKYKGTALVVQWITASGTAVLTAESRTYEVNQQSNQIDVTVRSDTAKNFLPDFPAISASMEGLDTTGTPTGGTPAQAWDKVNIGDSGTLQWGPEGTATGNRKDYMPAIVKTKTFSSPYDGAVNWKLEWDAQGAAITQSAY